MSENMFHIDELLRQASQLRASDIHFTVELPPMLRIDGDLKPVPGMPVLKPPDTERVLLEMLSALQLAEYRQQGSVDFSRSLPGVGRFRVNAYRQRHAAALALRLIPIGIPRLANLALPKVISELARKNAGLVIVTGPTGSGKSTTLAAMIGQINSEESLHILTLEDPIEFLHRHEKSMVNQREIGPDTPSFASGLRAALREDPDVILVGEMRDYDTTQIAISAAETGHLVLTTLHTPSASQTIDRIIDIFPPHQQSQVRIQLAASLQGVVAQQLLPRADGPGRVACVEVLLATPAVRNLIREGKTHQLPSIIQTNSRLGMITMDASLRDLRQRGIISQEIYEVYSQEFTLMKILE